MVTTIRDHQAMSFNDLERGANTSSPPPSSGGALNGQQYGRGSGRSSRGGVARGPLPLYHAPRSDASHARTGSGGGGGYSDATESASNPDFKRLADRIGTQIFKLNSNVQGIEKLVELQLRKMRASKTTGAPSSSSAASEQQQKAEKDWTAQIHDLTETTRTLVKDLSTSIKALTIFQPDQLSQTDRLTAAKLQREFEHAINAFARAQRESAKLSRTMLDGAKEQREKTIRASAAAGANQTAVDETLVQVDEDGGPSATQEQTQVQQQTGPSLAEIEFQETLIAERESEIREIETGIQELNEIFRDLGHIVQEQGGMIDNIEYNVQTIATNTGAADRELISASDYQRRAGRRAACLMLIVGFVVAVVLLAVSRAATQCMHASRLTSRNLIRSYLDYQAMLYPCAVEQSRRFYLIMSPRPV
jgi:syntaxin 7